MGKSKSHPCKHPDTARRDHTDAEPFTFWCHKCKQRVGTHDLQVVKPEGDEFYAM